MESMMTDQCFTARSFFAAAAAAAAATGSPFSMPPIPGYPDITDPRMANFIRERMLFGLPPGTGNPANFSDIVGQQFPVGSHPFASNPSMLWSVPACPPPPPPPPPSSGGKATGQQQQQQQQPQSSPSIEQLQQIYMQNPWYAAAMLSGNNNNNGRIPPPDSSPVHQSSNLNGSSNFNLAATQLATNPQLWAAFAAAYGNGPTMSTAQQQQQQPQSHQPPPPQPSTSPTSNHHHHLGPIIHNNKQIPSPDTFFTTKTNIETEKKSISRMLELSPDSKSIKQELDNNNITTTMIDVTINNSSTSPKRSTTNETASVA
ncbi:hypothetical protein DERF_009597 [Dermatophagoides farinae]|nr:hypothetical protein DERF_009597 [Dermatophagoides farinae]